MEPRAAFWLRREDVYAHLMERLRRKPTEDEVKTAFEHAANGFDDGSDNDQFQRLLSQLVLEAIGWNQMKVEKEWSPFP